MKLLITIDYCGGTERELLKTAADQSGFKPTHIVSGATIGTNSIAQTHARVHSLPFTFYPANWNLYDDQAGFLRNEAMVNDVDAVLAIWSGNAFSGTKHIIDLAISKNLPMYVYNARFREGTDYPVIRQYTTTEAADWDTKSHWNHRVVKHESNGVPYYTIHEVYYSDGKINGITEDSATAFGETVEELKNELKRMLQACDYPELGHDAIYNLSFTSSAAVDTKKGQ